MFEESPSLEEFEHGLPEKLPDQGARRRGVRIAIVVLLVIASLLTLTNFMRSQTAAFLLGTGTVRGVVLDNRGQPFQGEVYILGTDLVAVTDANGAFELSRVPAGDQSLIVADSEIGREFRIRVTAGETLDVGEIRFTATAIPGQ